MCKIAQESCSKARDHERMRYLVLAVTHPPNATAQALIPPSGKYSVECSSESGRRSSFDPSISLGGRLWVIRVGVEAIDKAQCSNLLFNRSLSS